MVYILIRLRPAYVETATPTPKDIVIVLDRSESMTQSGIWRLAQEAAKTVIGTLNPNDRVSQSLILITKQYCKNIVIY